MDSFSERIRRLTPQQRELLLRGVAQHERSLAVQRIPRRASSGDAPLAFAQQRLWFLHQMSDSGGAYHIPLLLQLRGPLEPAALRRSLQAVVDRHDVLRATFPSTDGWPRQRIAPRLTCPLPELDLSEHRLDEQQARLRRTLEADLQQPFSLEKGPILRAKLVRMGPEDHVLLLILHHIVADGWSLGILTDELATCYTADLLGVQPDLAPLPIQYPDFAVWQQSRWAEGAFESELAFWDDRLDRLTPLRLPTDSPRPTVQTYRGASESLTLPPPLSRRLQAYCRQQHVTLFSTLLAAFQILLARYSDQHDVAVGTPVAGRNRFELESLIGCFINTLVMRADLRADPPFPDFLARVREATLAAFVHQELPFEKLVERLKPDRDPARNPLVQVLFTVQNTPMHNLEMPRLEVDFPKIDSHTARFDLELNVWETQQGIRLIATYSADLFRHETISHLLLHYQALLEGILSDPSRRLSALPTMNKGDSQSSLQTWKWMTRDTRSHNAGTTESGPLARPDLAKEYLPPETDLEKRVAETWAAMLGLPFVGRFDDFFALGGDSLLAARTVHRLRDLLHTPLDVRAIFESRTVQAFAAHIETIRWARDADVVGESDEEFEF